MFTIQFITFVNGRSRQDILPEIESRIANKTADELQKGESDSDH